MRAVRIYWVAGLVALVQGAAFGQSTSIAKRAGREAKAAAKGQGAGLVPTRQEVLLESSLIAVPPPQPRKFKIHDLVTIIVREQKKYEANSELEEKKDFKIKSTLSAFAKPVSGTLGAATFRNGRPDIDYTFGSSLKGEGDVMREDELTMRITATVIDVKPNGNLVLEAKKYREIDEEVEVATLTGYCRSEDISAANTILSTQIAELNVAMSHKGAVRDAARRGWITKLLDFLRPI